MLKINDIVKKYGSKVVLNNINFEVNNGEVVGLLGPNGAGKSTLMKIITGYISQNSGGIEIDGEPISSNSVAYRYKIGYLPENNPLYLDMYVGEYLLYVAQLYRVDNVRESVDRAIAATGLLIESNKRIKELSKGYRQRVGLAQAIVHNPDLIILDEPTTGLDPNQIVEIRNLISDLGKHKAVLFSTHILQEVAAVCDRVFLIDRGNMVVELPKADVTVERLESEFAKIKL